LFDFFEIVQSFSVVGNSVYLGSIPLSSRTKRPKKLVFTSFLLDVHH